jgi:hypothetical protein
MLSKEHIDVVVEGLQFEQHIHVVFDYLIDYEYMQKFDQNQW